MKIVSKSISKEQLQKIAQETFGHLIKTVIDVEKEIIIVGGELHSDEEAILLSRGSKQSNLWGINLYPEKSRADWIEFDSMINLRPSQGNRSRKVDNPETRKKIIKVINKLIKK